MVGMGHPVSSSAISNPNPVKVRAIFKAKVNQFPTIERTLPLAMGRRKRKNTTTIIPSDSIKLDQSIPLKRHRCRHQTVFLSSCRPDRWRFINPLAPSVTPLPRHARIDFSFFFIYRPRRRGAETPVAGPGSRAEGIE